MTDAARHYPCSEASLPARHAASVEAAVTPTAGKVSAETAPPANAVCLSNHQFGLAPAQTKAETQQLPDETLPTKPLAQPRPQVPHPEPKLGAFETIVQGLEQVNRLRALPQASSVLC